MTLADVTSQTRRGMTPIYIIAVVEESRARTTNSANQNVHFIPDFEQYSLGPTQAAMLSAALTVCAVCPKPGMPHSGAW